MFRVIRVLLLLAILAGTFLLFDKNSESITIYFFRDNGYDIPCLLYTSPSPRDKRQSRMPSSA